MLHVAIKYNVIYLIPENWRSANNVKKKKKKKKKNYHFLILEEGKKKKINEETFCVLK